MTDRYAELRAALEQQCSAILIEDVDTIRSLLAERDALIHDNYEYVSAANELATENQRLREALKLAYGAMNYMGDILNGMDAVEPEDVDATSPAFEAVRAALAQEQWQEGKHDNQE